MPNETKKNTPKRGTWSATRKHLATWDQPTLLSLVKDLYDASPGNRDFIDARCLVGDDGDEVLEIYRSKIVEQFFPKRGEGKLKLGEARKAIREYKKASGSISGTAELMMTYVENGVEFTCMYGDIGERFYDSVESVLKELATLLCGPGRIYYPAFSDRLAEIEMQSEDIGWGFHDYIGQVVGELEDELGGAS